MVDLLDKDDATGEEWANPNIDWDAKFAAMMGR